MLSTTQTLSCPTCGQPATIRVHTIRHDRNTQSYEFAAHLSFTCRRGCTLDAASVRALCGMDAGVVDVTR